MTVTTYKLEAELFQLLKNTYLELVKHELRQLNTYEEGSQVFKENSIPRGLYYIKSGRIKIVRGARGNQPSMYRIAGPGEFVGYLSLLKDLPYLSSASCLEKTEIWFIGKNVFFKALHEDLGFANGIIQMLSERLVYAEEYIIDLKTKIVSQRLATTLLSLNQQLYNGNNLPAVDLKKKDLAQIVSTTPETLSRELKKLHETGIIQLKGKIIFLKDIPKLLEISRLKD